MSESPSQDPLTEAPQPSSPLCVLCSVADDIEGKLVLGLLRSEGIQALSSADCDPGVLPLGVSDPGSILVLEHELAAARRTLAEHQMATFAVGVILAAGEGTRMGGPKAQLQLGTRSILDELVDAYSSSLVRELLVVLRPDSPLADSIDPNLATPVTNPSPEQGPLSSLWSAMDEIEDSADAILLHPVDVPVFDPEIIDDLVRRFERGEGPILVPTHAGKRGHPVLFGKACFPLLRQASLEQGARQVLREHPDLVVEVACSSPTVTMDLDTPADLEAFLRTYQPGSPDSE